MRKECVEFSMDWQTFDSHAPVTGDDDAYEESGGAGSERAIAPKAAASCPAPTEPVTHAPEPVEAAPPATLTRAVTPDLSSAAASPMGSPDSTMKALECQLAGMSLNNEMTPEQRAELLGLLDQIENWSVKPAQKSPASIPKLSCCFKHGGHCVHLALQ